MISKFDDLYHKRKEPVVTTGSLFLSSYPNHFRFECWVKDSNLRSPKAADLQSALVDRLSNPARISTNEREKGTFFPGKSRWAGRVLALELIQQSMSPYIKLFGKIIVLFHARPSIFKEHMYIIPQELMNKCCNF